MGFAQKWKGSAVDAEPKQAPRPREPEGSEWRRVRAFSKVLGREIVVSWKGSEPRVVFVDRSAYTLDEIATLKNGDPQAVRAAHETKSVFNGKVSEA